MMRSRSGIASYFQTLLNACLHWANWAFVCAAFSAIARLVRTPLR
jgi:hypothetical protein